MTPRTEIRRPFPAPSIAPLAAIQISLLILSLAALPAAGAEPYLVRDIRSGAAGSAPSELVTMGDVTYFVADDGIKGAELWKSDGTAGGTALVEDICPGSCSSDPESLTAVGGLLFFVANDGAHGTELWKSNGTAAGTAMVKDIQEGSSSTALAELTAVGQTLFFRALAAGTGYELWKSDGTAAGTVLVKDIKAGASHSFPTGLTAFNGMVFFDAGGDEGRELWKSDGTTAGTVLVKDIRGGSSGSTPRELTPVGNTLFFTAITAGRELWKSDGTTEGTMLVREIDPSSGESAPSELTEVGGLLMFLADDGVLGRELWKSDGSFAGTQLVADIAPGPASPGARSLVAMDGLVYFAADDGQMGEELWRSDGTLTGTWVVRDINPGPPASDPSSPSEFLALGSTLYFAANDGVIGNELCRSDGTWEGTESVADILPGSDGSDPSGPTAGTSLMMFAADDGVVGRELWAMQVGGAVLDLVHEFAADWAVVGTSGHEFTLTVTNVGISESQEVQVTSTVDGRLTVRDVSAGGDCSASSGQSIDCRFASLPAGGSRVITVSFDVGDGVEPILDLTNTAQAQDQDGQTADASDEIDLLAPCAPLPVDLILVAETIDAGGALYEACNSISVGPAVDVTASGEATFRAGGSIVLNNGFSVASGGSIIVYPDPLQSTE